MITRILGICGAIVCGFALVSRGLDTTQQWLLVAMLVFITVANWGAKSSNAE